MAHIDKTENGVIFLNDAWHIEDIQSIRDDLDDDQCIDVLEFLANRFDANEGINWDVIEMACNALYPLDEVYS